MNSLTLPPLAHLTDPSYFWIGCRRFRTNQSRYRRTYRETHRQLHPGNDWKASPRPDNLFLEILEQAAGNFGRNFCFDVVYTLALTRSGLPEDILEQLIYDWDELKFASLRRWLKGMITEQEKAIVGTFLIIFWNSIRENISIGLDYQGDACPYCQEIIETDENDALRKHETMYHFDGKSRHRRSTNIYEPDNC